MTGQGSRKARKARTRDREARAALVEGFPEFVRRHSKCRLCALVDADPDFLRAIHKGWAEGKGVRALETETRPKWAAKGETPLDHRSFHRHLRRHVQFTERSMTKTPPVSALAPVPEEPVDVGPGETGDYFDMRMIIDRLRTRMKEVDEKAALVDADGKVDSYALVMWLRLVSEFRSTIEAVNRMKNSDRLTKAILQAHTKRMIQLLSEPMAARFTTVINQLRQNPENAADVLEHLVATEVPRMVLRAADEGVKESCDTYRLH